VALKTDVYHGSGVPITKEAVVDMREVIYRLDPAQNPFLVLMNGLPQRECHNIKYEWMEREAFSRRYFPATFHLFDGGTEHAMAISFDAKYWNAIGLYMLAGADPAFANEASLSSVAPVRMTISPTVAGGTKTGDIYGWLKRSAYEARRNGSLTMTTVTEGVDTSTYYNAIQLTKDGTTDTTLEGETSEADLIIDAGVASGSMAESDWTDGAQCYVTVESHNQQVKGYSQGSGLGVETYKISQHLHNYTQIVKTPLSVTGTMKSIQYIGGPELTKRRFESGQSHGTDIECAIMFQGGGTEGVDGDWGILDNSYRPKTRLKGLGVGVTTAGKAGWITTNNPDHGGHNAALMTLTTASYTDYVDMMEAVYDDMKAGSQDKVLFCGTRIFKDLSLMALPGASPAITLNLDYTNGASKIGVNIKSLLTPFGNLSLVHHPMFAGQIMNYGLMLDTKNIELRPLVNRNTKLHIDVSSDEIDGQTDEFRTEFGIEVRHEHTHAIVKIG